MQNQGCRVHLHWAMYTVSKMQCERRILSTFIQCEPALDGGVHNNKSSWFVLILMFYWITGPELVRTQNETVRSDDPVLEPGDLCLWTELQIDIMYNFTHDGDRESEKLPLVSVEEIETP